ncbi:MAG: glycosyltransferase [Planctomycetes bacterium]|nr:glycosyltransferase [Planctomycetota bacterium]
MSRIVTFTNLFPSAVVPTHGLFVYERMRRVAARTGLAWRVVAPVPNVWWPLRSAAYRQWAKVPPLEVWQGVPIVHPRYRHWPGLSQRRQATAMARGAYPAVQLLSARGRIVLDAHYLWPDGVAAGLLARDLGVPFTLTARGSDLNVLANDPVIAAAIAEAAGRAFACCAVSSALGDTFAAVTGLARARIRDVRNGVDLERFQPGEVAAARTQLGLPVGPRLVLGIGRLVTGKGFAVAAQAVARLGADVQFVLVGDGPERAAIAAALPSTRFLGALPPDGVATACRAADVLVLPSEREGWPNVVTEALACGLPVVASRVGGIPQILGDPVPPGLGALVEPRDVDGLTAALQRVLAQPADRAGVRRFAERYGWDEPVATLAEVFQRALEGA